MSLPSRERGLKSITDAIPLVIMLSLPSRERGLKFETFKFTVSGWIASLPSRERGLKFQKALKGDIRAIVAPFAGAWIEIVNCPCPASSSCTSLPSRERGLKCLVISLIFWLYGVAPFAGAWIEMLFYQLSETAQSVAPFAGAWIEIEEAASSIAKIGSLPSRERGLKYSFPLV